MGTADWGIWTDPPASKTASAQIPFTEWNNMIASGNLGYLITGMQNTSLGHAHDGLDSRPLFRSFATAVDTSDLVVTNQNWANVAGWSAVITAQAPAILRYAMAASMELFNDITSARAIVNGTAQSAPAYHLKINQRLMASWEWLTAVPSGVTTVIGQLWNTGDASNSALVRHKTVVVELFQTA